MINEVRLLGRLAKDPQVREFQSGGAVCNLRVITSRFWKDHKTGEPKEDVQGHNVSIRISQVAKRAAETLQKGALVYVAGTLETRKWEGSDGSTRYTTEVVIRPYQGTFRRLPSGTIQRSAEGDIKVDDEVEIDYMSEITPSDTFSLGGGEEDPFS